jgi:hypothetical protein
VAIGNRSLSRYTPKEALRRGRRRCLPGPAARPAARRTGRADPDDHEGGTYTSAQFALDMIEGVQKVRFVMKAG